MRKKIIIIEMRAVIKKELWKGFEPRLKWYKIHYCNDANLFSLQRTSKKFLLNNFLIIPLLRSFSYFPDFVEGCIFKKAIMIKIH